MRKKYFIVGALLSVFLIDNCSERTGRNSVEENETSNHRIDSSEEKLTYKNPALMAGSDLLSVLRRLYANQDYYSMLTFTSRSSINQFGESAIMEFFKTPNLLGPEVKLKSIIYESDSSECRLNYQEIIFGTKHFKSIQCSIENDSAKLVLCNLTSIFCE